MPVAKIPAYHDGQPAVSPHESLPAVAQPFSTPLQPAPPTYRRAALKPRVLDPAELDLREKRLR